MGACEGAVWIGGYWMEVMRLVDGVCMTCVDHGGQE